MVVNKHLPPVNHVRDLWTVNLARFESVLNFPWLGWLAG